jgi:hypothetical protein
VYVQERREGLGGVIRLHGLGGQVPGAPFLNAWVGYTEVTTWIILFSALSGIYLWLFRRKQRVIGWRLSLGGGLLILGLILYIWLRGQGIYTILRKIHLYRGETWQFEYFHPDTLNKAVISADRAQVLISRQALDWRRTLIGLHR